MKAVRFERAIFFSWYCGIRDCAYCYMSTQPPKRRAVRSKESLLAELLLCKRLGWDIGFISGGVGAFSQTRFKELLKEMYKVRGEKFWLNIGALGLKELKEYLPYTKGVVGSIETVNKEIHKRVCPSKLVEPYFKMWEKALGLGLRTGMTIILGLGESIKDFPELRKIIKRYKISKIHFYGLNPQKGTVFEKAKPPSVGYQAEWIRKTRAEFPLMDIQCGIWVDRVERVGRLLEAGADSISKFPALKKFGSKEAREMERQVKRAGKEFRGTLTELPKVDWKREVKKYGLGEGVLKKVLEYVKVMERNIKK